MASLFTKILKGEIPGEIVHEDELCFALKDIDPKAPVHLLIIPKKEIQSIAHSEKEDQATLGHLFLVAKKLAHGLGLDSEGYRLVTNIGENGGQSVPHLHVHLLGGRPMG
ncbi:MAG TPA: histidine triad nucleotide-binding protein [Bdellovibrionales bacterium]|nr:histidine triad nucleotide-binding protein [Pseudobdellovibrionaceae bacterium]HAG90944.1 histidine triad nucleotide-binding protein [Bdellovibrionales bacterium]|tara:strand:+ start:1269 stop:1598 length:330 start_codon:yes stop_codon:yes gene_type:complete